jgi:ribosomal protein S18 acetylase RimI-like enzyme
VHRKIVEFREVTPADVPSLFYVRTRTRENGYTLEELAGLGITEKTVIEKLSSSFKGWLCQFDDLVVGFCMADRGTGELWVIAVLPDFERKGVGNRLMALAEEWLWASGCNRAWLTTDVDTKLRAYGFYRNRGWVDWKVENGLRWMQLFPPRTTSP